MTTHLDDGTLVRWLDRESESDEQAATRVHLESCPNCSGRLARLEARSTAWSAALRAADEIGSAARPGPRWGLRAAAAGLVLLSVAGAVRPVRAWIVERAVALWATLGGGPQSQRLAAPAPLETAVSFVPAGGGFTIELSGRQTAGRLVVEAVPGDTARAAVSGGDGSEGLVVLPSGLRITGPTRSTASYRILLPARLGPVRVTIGAETPRAFDPAGPPLQIELGHR
jgi:hypothetical protein